MKALFSSGDVPLSRVVRDHRRWLIPLAIMLAINLVVLLGVVLPLRRSVAPATTQAACRRTALRRSHRELKNAEATRDGQAQATTDLDTLLQRGAASRCGGGAPDAQHEARSAGARRTT